LTVFFVFMAAGLGCSKAAEENVSIPEPTVSEEKEMVEKEEMITVTDPIAETPIAICIDKKNVQIYEQVKTGFIEKAKELGYTNVWCLGSDCEDNQFALKKCLEWANAGGKAILVWVDDPADWLYIEKINNAGCIVGTTQYVNHDEIPDYLNFSIACSPDNYGAQVAAKMAEALHGKKGRVVITSGERSLDEFIAEESFRNEWELQTQKYDLSEIVLFDDCILVGKDYEEAKKINISIMQALPDTIGIFDISDNSLSAWTEVVEMAGKAGSVWIAGMHGSEDNLALLDNGDVNLIVNEPFFEQGVMAMEYFDSLLKGDKVPRFTEIKANIENHGGVSDSLLQSTENQESTGDVQPEKTPVLADGEYYGYLQSWDSTNMTVELMEYLGLNEEETNLEFEMTGKEVTLNISESKFILESFWSENGEEIQCESMEDALDTEVYFGGTLEENCANYLFFRVKDDKVTEILFLYMA